MLSVYFDKENDKDFKQINEMQNMAQELCNCVKEMGELINMLLAFNFSQYAFESLKLLKELQEYEMAKKRNEIYVMKQGIVDDSRYDMSLIYHVEGRSLHFGRPEFSLITALHFGTVSFPLWRKGEVKFVSRVLPKKVGDKVTNLDLLSVIEDEELMGNLCDEDAVRVCLLLSLEEIFMGRLLVDVVDDSHMRLVEKIEE
nr:phospholipase-like protein [Tanacetum cinerariifolium]